VTVDNPLLAAWQRGDTTFGVWCALPTSVATEMVSSVGFDYACIDMQHGAVGYTSAVPMLQAARGAGASPIVRVPWNEPGAIMKVLDAGALGVVVPLVSTVEEAEAAVAACRYPPNGIRSFGPIRASFVTGSRDVRVLERVACVVMVETAEGLAQVDDIARVPGVDAIYVGPADLAIELGLPPAYERPEPEHGAAIDRIRRACAEAGIVAGIQCDGAEMALRRAEQGFRMITIGNEGAWMRTTAAQQLEAAREGLVS
jgi:4-hydroxy-2-oxoheptanedioate aldolase